MPSVTLDPRTPVIVGVGQWTNRVDEGADPRSPIGLMVGAARTAAEDAGAPEVLGGLDAVRVVSLLSWRYRDPARLVADRLGATGARSGLTWPGGNSPQALLNTTAMQIQRGDLDLALLCGGEAWRTRKAVQRDGERPDWDIQADEVEPDERFGADLEMNHEAETAVGLFTPAQMYPLFDHALRIGAGRSVDEQRALIGRLWARFSEVAAANPHAWRRQPLTPTEVIHPGPDNRLVGHPYTKAVNSYEWVDQAAALLVCSVERARSLGVAQDRWVFPVAGAEATEPAVSVRRSLDTSASMHAAGAAVLAAARCDIDDISIVDLYSCFPSAVLMAADALGVGLDRDLTVTGGMSFFGGPWNDYVTHAVATTVERLRAEPDERALVTANGGFTNKQAFGVYAGRPPGFGFRHEPDAPPPVAAGEAGTRAVVTDHRGPVAVESWTVLHDREGEPETGFVAGLTADGARCWAATDDRTVMDALEAGALDRGTITVNEGAVTGLA